MKFKRGDIVVVILLIVAAIGWFAQDFIWPNTEKKVAVIEIDGKIYKKVALNNNRKKQEFQISLPDNNFIHIVQERDVIFVKDASCPDKICKKTGEISETGQNIVCLPNKVVIYIKGEDNSNIDDLSF